MFGKSEWCNFPTPKGRQNLILLFLPFLADTILNNLMGTVNTIVLSRYSDDAVAAVGAANQVMILVYTLHLVVGSGSSIYLSQRLGAGDRKTANQAAYTVLRFSLIFGMVIAGIMLMLSGVLMRLMNLEGSILSGALVYFRICVLFSFMQAVTATISAIFRSYGRPVYAVAVSLLMNVFNIILNLIVILNLGKWHMSGEMGIALANTASRFFALLLAVFILYRQRMGVEKPAREKMHIYIANILKIGIPVAIGSISYSISQVVSTSIIAGLGKTAITTKIYVSTVTFYVYAIGLSMGTCMSVVVGWLKGAKEYDRAVDLNKKTLLLTSALNLTGAVIVFVFSRNIMGLFTADQAIIQMAIPIFAIDVFLEVGRGFNHIEEGSLRGSGDVFFAMMVSVLSCWFISILFSYILGIRLGLGLKGCWIAFMLDELIRGCIQFLRWRSGAWKRIGEAPAI